MQALNNVTTKCGGHSFFRKTDVNGFLEFTHTTCHTSHKESSDAIEQPEDSSVFYIPVTYKALIDISYQQAKALAFLCLVRAYEQVTNIRSSYTINSLHELTGVHAKTIEGRINTLDKMGLIGYNEVGRILIKKAKARHSKHNTTIKIQLDGKALKNAENAQGSEILKHY